MLMTNGSICCIRRNQAISYAAAYLSALGHQTSVYPARNTAYLMLPVPSFPNGAQYLESLLPEISVNTTIIGGNLDTPLLTRYRTIDLLKDPYYLAQNAAITAECAIQSPAASVS